MTQTVAMTGATGFIGWHVARCFQEKGWDVRALVRPESRRPLPDGVERVTAALDEAAILAACRGANLIVHMAAVIQSRSPVEFTRTNVDGTRAVARAARALGVRLLHTSSLGVTGPGTADNPPTEDDPPRPINLYGETKREGERIVRELDGLDWTIVRPTLVYGPRDRLFLPVFKLARHGIFPMPNPAAAYNLVHVEDVARGVERAATSSAGSREVFFLGHPTNVSAGEMMSTLAGVFGRTFRAIVVPRPLMRMAAELGTVASRLGIPVALDRARWRELRSTGFVCRANKAQERLGFVAQIDLANGFAATAAWYGREGWLNWDPGQLRLATGPPRA